MRITIDDSELRTLSRDLSGAPLRIQFNANKVLRRGAEIIDAGMRVDASGHRYLGNLPNAVSHELIAPLTAEIGLGPNSDQGSIAHIIVYGSVNNGPVYDHTAALRRSTPAITEMFADACEDSVFGGSRAGRG